jgi:hypothetical protein
MENKIENFTQRQKADSIYETLDSFMVEFTIHRQ